VNLLVAANTTSGNVISAFYGNLYGNVVTANQPYITSIGNLGNLTVAGNITAANISANITGNIRVDTITPNVTPVTVFNSNTAIGLPSGPSSSRPNAASGYIRFNSDIGTLEFYTGSAWQPLTNTISDQQITPSGATASFTLDQNASPEGLLVSINGTVQRPGAAYSVLGNIITFAEIPGATDIIDVRYIAAATAVTLVGLAEDISTTGNITGGNISAGGLTLTSALQFANLTTAQVNTISAPTRGMTVYNYTTGNIQVYNGAKWANVTLS